MVAVSELIVVGIVLLALGVVCICAPLFVSKAINRMARRKVSRREHRQDALTYNQRVIALLDACAPVIQSFEEHVGAARVAGLQLQDCLDEPMDLTARQAIPLAQAARALREIL